MKKVIRIPTPGVEYKRPQGPFNELSVGDRFGRLNDTSYFETDFPWTDLFDPPELEAFLDLADKLIIECVKENKALGLIHPNEAIRQGVENKIRQVALDLISPNEKIRELAKTISSNEKIRELTRTIYEYDSYNTGSIS